MDTDASDLPATEPVQFDRRRYLRPDGVDPAKERFEGAERKCLQRATDHFRLGVHTQLEARNHAKKAWAGATRRPIQICVLGFTGVDNLAIRGDDFKCRVPNGHAQEFALFVHYLQEPARPAPGRDGGLRRDHGFQYPVRGTRNA